MDFPDGFAAVVLALGVAAACFVSAAAGLGGSLLLVPLASMCFGAKQGIAVAATLLAFNNVLKLVAYRRSLPLRAGALLMACATAGALLGARLLVGTPETVVSGAVIAALVVSFCLEVRPLLRRSRSLSAVLSFASGASSGFSGTSGSLKGLAIRSLGMDRLSTVGAATLVSVTTDAAKTAVFLHAGILDRSMVLATLGALPLMAAATLAGRRLTLSIDERGYAWLFWLVLVGYTARLLLT